MKDWFWLGFALFPFWAAGIAVGFLLNGWSVAVAAFFAAAALASAPGALPLLYVIARYGVHNDR